MNASTQNTIELSANLLALRELLSSEIVLIGGGELVAEFH